MSVNEKVEIVVRLPVELHEKLREHSDENERSMAGTIRMALRLYLGGK